jgi:hypothetical protein
MFIKRFIRRYMEQAGGEGGTGGTTTATTTSDTTTTAADSTTSTTAASLLATGAATTAATTTDYIPEKFRVNNAEGAFDLDASSRSMADAYGNLEKRLGGGDAPPKTAAEYTVTVPDALKDAFDPATDVGMQGFMSGAVEAGLTQKQMDFVMGKYFEMAPTLAAGAKQYDVNTATTELKAIWATDADFNRNVKNAYVGTNAAAQKAGLNVDDIMNGPLGNNPQFLRLMASLGPEFQEDAAVGGTMTTATDINGLLSSEAYSNPKHVDHAKVSAQIKQYFERKHGTEAAA